MRIEDLTPQQFSQLQKAKAEVLRVGFLNPQCTDQQFLNALAVHRHTRELLLMLSKQLHATSPRLKSMTKAFEVFERAAEQLWDQDGVWDTDGWRPS
ncbi:MAG: hypothetical protein ACYTGW_07125 [Planctomycetota bacterium]|jgi:hypothetical protein